MKKILKDKDSNDISKEVMWTSIETPLKLFLEETFGGNFNYQLLLVHSLIFFLWHIYCRG